MIIPIRLGISNAFLIKEERTILVDTGRPHEAPVIVQALEREGGSVEDLALIVHTHGHWDHAGATWQLKAWTRTPTAIHRADADKLRQGRSGALRPIGLSGLFLRPFLRRTFPAFEADILLDDAVDLARFGVRGRVIGTPGHTPGSVSVLTAEGDAIVGDLLMGGYLGGKLLPRVPGYHYFAEDFDLLKMSIARLIDLRPTRIFPGHGGPLSLQAVERCFRRELVTSLKVAKKT
jgi:glyoxylase-like metal-dependent hydrolase (beta-lactamase superfamily II)